jgi:hypothetical protein
MTATVEEGEGNGEGEGEGEDEGEKGRRRTSIRAVSLLGSIAAIESFCDFVVPWVYGFGLWDWVVELRRASLIFVLGAFFYFLASIVVGWRMSTRRNN